MSDRKVFSELLETLHRGRDKPAEQQAPRGAAAGPQRKGGTNCPPKNTKSRSNPGKTSARERGKPSGSATVCNSGNTLDCGDLEQRYGKLNLTSVRPACSWSSPTKGQPVSDSCSPMQIQSPNGGAEPAKELSPAEAYRAALAAASMPPSFMGIPGKDLEGCSGAPVRRANAMLRPSEPAQSCAPPTESIPSTKAVSCEPDWSPHGSLPGAQRPHVAASSLAAKQQRSAPQQWAYPGCPAPAPSGAQQAQHASSACSNRRAAPTPYQAYQAALRPQGGPEPSCPGWQQPERAAQHVFQRFSRQQEAMHFADCMNAEHRTRAQPAAGPLTQQLDSMEAGIKAEPLTGCPRASPPACSEPTSRPEDPVKVFCLEQPSRDGKFYRGFLAADYAALWAHHERAQQRHFYEVVREGTPCHLYFDLEYVPEHNPGFDGPAAVITLVEVVREGMRRHWGLELRDEWVWELDSSSPSKWSRHLIIACPGHAFPNNLVMGDFVRSILSPTVVVQFRVLKPDGRQHGDRCYTCFVDLAVYSRNRHFRMAWSSKGGKPCQLTPTDRFAAAAAGLLPRQVLLRTLVMNVSASAQLLQLEAAPEASSASAPAAAPVSDTAQVLEVLQKASQAVKVTWKMDDLDKENEEPEPAADLRRWAGEAMSLLEGVAAERAGGQPATVRTVRLCGTAGLVAFSMIGPGAHYCENIRRAHCSNYVYFVVNLRNAQYAQKCHDPECAHFRSAWMPLPRALVLPSQAPQLPSPKMEVG